MLSPLLLLFLAQSDAIDTAVKGIPSYNASKALPPAGDEVFLKRLTRDLVDDAPDDAELKVFVADPDPKKRAKAIDRLLADPRFGAFWAKRFRTVFFDDVRNFPWTELPELSWERRAKAVENFTTWLATKLNADAPWTDVVAAMMSARGTLEADPALAYLLSFRRGLGFSNEFAERVSRQLLGVRLQCARCHDQPFDAWGQNNYYGMAAWIVRQRAVVTEAAVTVTYADFGELVFESGKYPYGQQLPPGVAVLPWFLFGAVAAEPDDRMKVFAKLITQKTTTQLPRALANRVWEWLFGNGVVHPVDDFNIKNKPLSPALMEGLTRLLVDNHYSVKQLVRVVCNSKTYQQLTPEESPAGESFRHAARKKFNRPPHLPLPAAPLMLPVALDVPAGWTRVLEPLNAKALFLIPHPDDADQVQELYLIEGMLDPKRWPTNAGCVQDAVHTETLLEGKGGLKILFTEAAGINPCQLKPPGPVSFRRWSAALDTVPPLHFRVAGPADHLDPARAAFLQLLQSLSKN